MQNAIKEARKNVEKNRNGSVADPNILTEENLAQNHSSTVRLIDQYGEGVRDSEFTAKMEDDASTVRESNMNPPRQSELESHHSEIVDDDASDDSGRTDETKRRLKFEKQPAVSLVALLFTPMKCYTASVDHSK